MDEVAGGRVGGAGGRTGGRTDGRNATHRAIFAHHVHRTEPHRLWQHVAPHLPPSHQHSVVTPQSLRHRSVMIPSSFHYSSLMLPSSFRHHPCRGSMTVSQHLRTRYCQHFGHRAERHVAAILRRHLATSVQIPEHMSILVGAQVCASVCLYSQCP